MIKIHSKQFSDDNLPQKTKKCKKEPQNTKFIPKIYDFLTVLHLNIFRPHVQGGSHNLIKFCLFGYHFLYILAQFEQRNPKEITIFRNNLPPPNHGSQVCLVHMLLNNLNTFLILLLLLIL